MEKQLLADIDRAYARLAKLRAERPAWVPVVDVPLEEQLRAAFDLGALEFADDIRLARRQRSRAKGLAARAAKQRREAAGRFREQILEAAKHYLGKKPGASDREIAGHMRRTLPHPGTNEAPGLSTIRLHLQALRALGLLPPR